MDAEGPAAGLMDDENDDDDAGEDADIDSAVAVTAAPGGGKYGALFTGGASSWGEAPAAQAPKKAKAAKA